MSSADHEMRRVVRSSLLLVLAGLALAALLAPAVAITGTGESAGPVDTLGWFELLSPSAEEFHVAAEVDSHPYAVPGGLWLIRIGAPLLCLAVVGLLGACVVMHDEQARVGTKTRQERGFARRIAIAGTACGCAVLVAVVAVMLGVAWLPESEAGEAGPRAGMLLALMTGAWALHATWAWRRLT